MTIRHPKGIQSNDSVNEADGINYARRGMTFEKLINESNQYYLAKNIAVIHKKPTPIQVVTVDYPKRSAVKITEAYYKEASTTDYNGVYKGYYIDFEAKATKLKTRFPLNNLQEHQIDHMISCQKQGGIVFLLIYFSTLKECYLMPFSDIKAFWCDNASGQKSIPYTYIKKNCYAVPFKLRPRVDYLAAVNHLMIQLKGVDQ